MKEVLNPALYLVSKIGQTAVHGSYTTEEIAVTNASSLANQYKRSYRVSKVICTIGPTDPPVVRVNHE